MTDGHWQYDTMLGNRGPALDIAKTIAGATIYLDYTPLQRFLTTRSFGNNKYIILESVQYTIVIYNLKKGRELW